MAKEKTDKCKCMPGMGLVALILAVIGLYVIVLGVKTQLSLAMVFDNWMAMLYYLIGVLVLACAKMSKHCAYCKCDMHKM